MNFNLYKSDGISFFEKINKRKSRFLLQKNSDVEIFHVNKLSSDQLHAVFYISDEYKFGTKNFGEVLSVPFNQYINTFLFSYSPLFLVESINNNYSNMVTDNLEKDFDNKVIQKVYLTNEQMLAIVVALNATIKLVEFEKDDETFELDDIPKHSYSEIFAESNDIHYLLISVREKLMSIKMRNTISVNNSEEDYLIKFTGEIINALK